MSCGTCGVQASNTMQGDTGVPAGAPTTARARCPYCRAFIAQVGAACANRRCPGPPKAHGPRTSPPSAPAHRVLRPTPAAASRAAACRDPEQAYRYALEVDQGPHDDTRAAACQDPVFAYQYALNVDKGPREDTRQAACRRPANAGGYAEQVDKCPREDTRAAACQDPDEAYFYARYVDKGPRDDTRAAACQAPNTALRYAEEVDRRPRDDTRAAACQDPSCALHYAGAVDRRPRDDTRAAACREAETAFLYALEVDRTPRDDTRAAISRDPKWAARYDQEVRGTARPGQTICTYCHHRLQAGTCPNPRCPGKRGEPGPGTVPVAEQQFPPLAWVRQLLRTDLPRVRYPVQAAYIVGSRARQDVAAHPNSDLDIAVVIPPVRGKTALAITEWYHQEHDRRWPMPQEYAGCTVDIQFFYPDDPELAGYDKIPLT